MQIQSLEVDNSNATIMTTTTTTTNTTAGYGSTTQNVTLAFTFNPDTIRQSPIITNTGLESSVSFCVRFSAYSADYRLPGTMEIVYRETYVTLQILQGGNISVDPTVIAPSQSGQQWATQQYTLIGYLCNETNHEITNPDPIFQGQLTRVCVTPNDYSLQNGVYMRAIDSFYWTRDTIYQPAIYPHESQATLTQIYCEPGLIICAFETLLKAAFFYSPGIVDGSGVGWLQVRCFFFLSLFPLPLVGCSHSRSQDLPKNLLTLVCWSRFITSSDVNCI